MGFLDNEWKMKYTSYNRKARLSKVIAGVIFICIVYFFWTSHYSSNGISGLDSINMADYPPLGIDQVEDLPTEGDFRIPKIIHQTWKTTDIPNAYVKWMESWVKVHPDWTYMFWTDDSARQLIAERHPNLLASYDGYLDNIRRADAMRYVILYEFGGVYADLDMESLRPMDGLMRKYSCVLPQEPYEHPIMDGNFEHLVINALLACKAKHPLMKKYMDNLPAFYHMWHVLDSTGPHYVTLLYHQYLLEKDRKTTEEDGVYLAPAEYFFPTIDPEKFGYMREKCVKFNTISELQQRACVSLKVSGFERKPYKFSFTNHHWMHTYFKVRMTFRGPVNLLDFIPNAKIYKLPKKTA